MTRRCEAPPSPLVARKVAPAAGAAQVQSGRRDSRVGGHPSSGVRGQAQRDTAFPQGDKRSAAPSRPSAGSSAYIHLQIMKRPCFVSQYGAFVAIGGRNAAAPRAWAVGRPRAAFAVRLSCPGLLCCGPSGRPRRALWHGEARLWSAGGKRSATPLSRKGTSAARPRAARLHRPPPRCSPPSAQRCTEGIPTL